MNLDVSHWVTVATSLTRPMHQYIRAGTARRQENTEHCFITANNTSTCTFEKKMHNFKCVSQIKYVLVINFTFVYIFLIRGQ